MNSTPLPFLPAELWNKIYDDKEIFEIAEAKKNHGIQLQLLHTEMIRKGDFESAPSYWDTLYYDDYKKGDIYEHVWVTEYLRCITHFYPGSRPSSKFTETYYMPFWDDYDELGISTSLREFRGNPFDDDYYEE